VEEAASSLYRKRGAKGKDYGGYCQDFGYWKREDSNLGPGVPEEVIRGEILKCMHSTVTNEQ
jgi:hypothetical protein